MNLEKEIEEINKYKGREIYVKTDKIYGRLIQSQIVFEKHITCFVNINSSSFESFAYYAKDIIFPGKELFLFNLNKRYEV